MAINEVRYGHFLDFFVDIIALEFPNFHWFGIIFGRNTPHTYTIRDYNKLRGLKRYLEHFGWFWLNGMFWVARVSLQSCCF